MTFIDGWNHIFSQSDRSSSTGTGFLVAYTRSSTLASREFNSWTEAFTGQSSGNGGPYYSSGSLVAGTDYFDWQFSEAVAINGMRFWGGDVTDLGTWQVAGSNDGSSYTDIGSTFHWNQVNSGIGSSRGCEITFTNTTPYLYYRLKYVSGTFNGGRLCDRIHFRMNHSDLGGGDRSSSPHVIVTAGPTSLTPRNSRTVADFVDGRYHNGQPTAGTDQVSLDAPAANDSIHFNFGSTAVKIKRWILDGDAQFSASYGTWQWEGSHNGSSWTASGSSFSLTGAGKNVQLFTTQIPSSSDYYEHWRLKYLSGSTSNLNGMYEFVFDLDETIPDGNASGDTITVTASLIAGNASDATVSGVTFTVTSSLTAGTAFEETVASGDTVTVTSSISVSGVVHLEAIDGSAIYEFATSAIASEVYLSSDYDSIYSRGDRIANRLIAAGEYGWTTVFSHGAEAFDNIFNGNGPAAGGTPVGASFWFSAVEDEALDIRGFTLIGGAEINSLENWWGFFGGISPGNYSFQPYFTIDAFNPNQLTEIGSPDYDGTFWLSEYEYEPRVFTPFPHFEVVYFSGPRPDVRWTGEMWLKIAHSNLDGGDRREGHAAPSKTVKFTASADWSFRTGTDKTLPGDSWFDGGWEHLLHKNRGEPGAASNTDNPVTTVGAWFGFEFPRPVIPRHLLFVNFNNQQEVYIADEPTIYGKWHWEYSLNGGATWTAVGDTWWFRDQCTYMVAPQSSNFNLGLIGDTGHGALKWRMVLDEGPAFGNGVQAVQVIFDLLDVTGQQPPYEIHFTDDTDSTPVVATIGPPGSAYVVPFSDGPTDGLTLTVQNIPNPVLTIAFTDEGEFDHWSDLYPSLVVQTVIIATGR